MDMPSLLTTITSVFGYGYSESQSSPGLPNSTQILSDPVELSPEEPVQLATECNPHEAASLEEKDYSVSTAQWTPEWPSDLEETLKSNVDYPDTLPSNSVIQVTGSQSLPPEEQIYNLDSAQWTPQWPENFLETVESESPGIDTKSAIPSGGPFLNLTPESDPRAKWPSEVTREESNTSVVTDYSKLDSSILEHETKKWIIELGSNRNYIKALVNRSNADWASVTEMNVHSAVDNDRGAKKGRWVINYDNLNYIRSQINPDVLEKVLREELERSIVEQMTFSMEEREVTVN